MNKQIVRALTLLLLSSIGSVEVANAQALLEEIVVTAQKREQNIQSVGTSVTAFSGDQIRELGFTAVGDVATQTPNFNFAHPSGSGSNPALSIRGVGLNDFADSNEGPVAMYVDEVYLGSLAGQTANLYDIQRVEVLRGPQGTLYGRNTTGGLVHFVTNKPTDSFEAYGQLTAGTFSQVKFEGALSGPFSERVRGRVAAFYDSDDGVQERDLGTGVKGNAKDIFSARALLDIDMSESWNLLLNVHGSRTRNDSQLYKFRGILDPVTGAPCDRATFETFACVDAFGNQDSNPALEVPFTLGFGRTPLDIDLFGTSATLNWESDQWSLISITGYESTEKFHRDTTGSFPPILLQPIFRIDAEQLTQELRLTNTSDNLVWLVGLFYFDDNKKGGNSLEGPPFPDNAAPLTYNIFHDQDTEALALFAHSDWNINDSWSLRVGVRYTNEDKSLVDDVDTDILFAPAPPFVFTDSISTDHISWNCVTSAHMGPINCFN